MAVKLGNGNWAVKEDKLLAYNDNSGLFFNKEFDFTRGTSATYVAKDGLIKTAGIQPNIVTNGTFDTDSDWGKYVAGDSNSITIANGVLSFNSNTNQNVFQTISSSNLDGFYKLTYTITSYTRGNAYFLLGGGSNIYLGSTVGTHTKYVQGGGSNANLIIYGGIFGQGGELSIDNVTVQEIQTDTPRIDFTNDTKGHLLLEPSRTNSVPYSNDFSQQSIAGGSITSDDIVSPDGSINADTFVEDTNNSQHKIQKHISVTSGTYTMSCFVKGTDRFISLYPQGISTAYAVFDIANGNVTVSGGSDYVDSQIQSFENDWYRCSLTYNVGTGTSITHIYLSNSRTNPAPTYTGNGSEMSFYGLQLEQGDYSTSLINTTGAASTRNADVCNNSGSAQDFNSEEGVLYAEIAALADDNTNRQMAISDGSTNNRVVLQYYTITNTIRAVIISGGGPPQVDMSYTVSDTTEFHKIAIAYKQNDFGLWIGGVKRRTDLVGNAPSGLDRLNFDRGDGSSVFIQAKVRNVQVFTEALTDEQLEKLTS